MKKRLIFAVPLLVTLLLVITAAVSITSSVSAAEATPQPPSEITVDEVNAVARQLYCPVCENIPLDVCPTQACADWRETIRMMLIEGKSEQDIKDYFVERYGDRVLAEPPRRGLNWLIYILPVAFFLIGIFILMRTLLNMRARAGGAAGSLPEPGPGLEDAPTRMNDPYLARMEQELKRRKEKE